MEIVITIITVIATMALTISVYNLYSNNKFSVKIEEVENIVRENEKIIQLKNQYGLFARKRNE